MSVILKHLADGTLLVSGELSAENTQDLVEQMTGIRRATGGLRVDLQELELLDARAVIGVHELLRILAKRAAPVEILHAPQLLAHSLYRVGDLERIGLCLVEPREEEPYG